jgi:hypothetical protein
MCAATASAAEGQAASPSDIGRFSQVLEGDGDAGTQSHTDEPAADQTSFSDAAATNVAGSTTPSEEESLEEYMAKLMQRVRGEICAIPSNQGPQCTVPSAAKGQYDRNADGALPQV